MASLLDSVWAGPLVFTLSCITSATFYVYHNGWELSTALYFAAQTLLGCNYGGLTEVGFASKFVSLALYVLGTTLVAAAVGNFTNSFVKRTPHIRTDERKKNRLLTSAPVTQFLSNLSVVTLAVLWLGVGVAWGILHEGFTLVHAVYFSLAALSARGDPDPLVVCATDPVTQVEQCNLGLARACFYLIYTLVGVNLYVLSMSKVSTLLSERAVRQHEKELLERPLGKEEYEFVRTLSSRKQDDAGSQAHTVTPSKSKSKTSGVKFDLKDFIIMETLRLERVDRSFIQEISDLFREIDKDGNEVLDADDLLAYKRRFFAHDESGDEEEDDEGTRAYNSLFLPLIGTPNRGVLLQQEEATLASKKNQ